MKVTILLLLLATTAGAQTTAAPTFGPPIVDAPFSVVRLWESHKVLPNGKKQDSHSVLKLYRDAAGRTRSDMEIDSSGLVQTVVIDRATRVEYWWNNKSRICMMKKLGPVAGDIRAYVPIPVGETKTRYVGTGDQRRKEEITGIAPKTIDGVEALGTHMVRYAPGKDTVVASTVDNWFQPELRLALYTDVMDPVVGNRTYRYKDLKRANPSPELFAAPPKGYEVREAESPNEDKFE